jgi:hypothetical protein
MVSAVLPDHLALIIVDHYMAMSVRTVVREWRGLRDVEHHNPLARPPTKQQSERSDGLIMW